MRNIFLVIALCATALAGPAHAMEKAKVCKECSPSSLPLGTQVTLTKSFTFKLNGIEASQVIGKCLAPNEGGFITPCCQLIREKNFPNESPSTAGITLVVSGKTGGAFSDGFEFASNVDGIVALCCTRSWDMKDLVKALHRKGIDLGVEF